MKNGLHKNNSNSVTVQVHVEPYLIPLIQSNSYDKLDRGCVKIKLRRYPTSQKLDLYSFKMACFYNREPEDLL